MSGTTLAVDAWITQFLSQGAVAHQLAQFAKDEVAARIAAGEFPAQYETEVDGVRGASEEAVSPGGQIVYRAPRWGEAVAFAIEFLRARSPTRSSPRNSLHYRDSFQILIAGRVIQPGGFDETKVPVDEVVTVFSPLPYSRKIDVQTVGGRSLRFSSEPGLFQDAADAIGREFPLLQARRVARVRTYRGSARYVMPRRIDLASRASRRAARRAGRQVELPGVEIRLKQ